MDLTLPDGAGLGDEGHIADHNMIVAAIESLNSGKVETLTIGTVTTVESDVEAQASLTQAGPGSYSLSLVIPRGSRGDLGLTGATGAQGDPGVGMPTGGATGQFIKKNSNTNYDYTFGMPTASEVGAVPTSRQVSAGTGLSGGGALSGDVSLAVTFGTTSGTSVEGTHIGAADPHPGYLTPTKVVAGSNVTVDRTTTPGSVIISSSGGGTGSGDPGVLYLDSFSGTDDQRLAAAMTQVSGETYKRTIMLGNREHQFFNSVSSFYRGFKLSGAGGGASVEQPRNLNPYATLVWWRGSGTFLALPNTRYDGIFIGNAAFRGNDTSTFLARQSSSYTSAQFATGEIRNVGFDAWKHVIGQPSNGMQFTAFRFSGYWNINAGTDTAFNLSGSDNNFWLDQGLLLDSSQLPPVGSYHGIFTYLDLTNIGPIYCTSEPNFGGLKIASGQDRMLVFYGGLVAGRNTLEEHTYQTGQAILDISGDCITTLRDMVVGNAKSSPTTGVIRVANGARVDIENCVWFPPDNPVAGQLWCKVDGSGSEARFHRIRSKTGAKPLVSAATGGTIIHDGSVTEVDSSTITNDAEAGVATGTTVTLANSACPSACSALTTTGGTITFVSSPVLKGGLAYAVTNTSNADVRMEWDAPAVSNSGALRVYLRAEDLPAVPTRVVTMLSATPTIRFGVVLNADGKISLYDSTGTQMWISTGAISADTTYRIEAAMDNSGGTSGGTLVFKVYTGDGTSEIANLSTSLTGRNLGTTGIGKVYLGRYTGTASIATTLYFDDLKYVPATTTLIGPSA